MYKLINVINMKKIRCHSLDSYIKIWTINLVIEQTKDLLLINFIVCLNPLVLSINEHFLMSRNTSDSGFVNLYVDYGLFIHSIIFRHLCLLECFLLQISLLWDMCI